MQLRTSLKQVWIDAKSAPAYTALYIGGVAFAVAFTMVTALIFYVHIAPIYPEYKRADTSYLNQVRVFWGDHGFGGGIGKAFVEDFLEKSENCEAYTLSDITRTADIQPVGGDYFQTSAKYTDPAFFKAYAYEFVAGKPFDQADYDSGLRRAVVSDKLAKKLYGDPAVAVGKELPIDFAPTKIVGVVREGSTICFDSYAQVFLPLTLKGAQGYGMNDAPFGQYMGGMKGTLIFKDKAQREAFEEELNEKINRVTAGDTLNCTMTYGLQTHISKALLSDDDDSGMSALLRPAILVLLVLLIIPAINIGGMISGQMDRRVAEVAVRRSFGATKNSITSQILFENLVLTIVGGILGLVVAWLVVTIGRQWILNLFINSWYLESVSDIPVELTSEMLFAPSLFLLLLLICLLLNMLSAYLPIRLSLRGQIVKSINQKR